MPEREWKTSKVPDVWATFGIFQLYAIQMISCRDWWPQTKPGYITMTRRQSNSQWSGGIAAHPHSPQKIPSAKISWKSSRLPRIFWDQNWLSSKGPNYQHGVLFISAGAIEGYFEGKIPTWFEGHQGGHVLARQCLGSPGTYNPEKNDLTGRLPISSSPILYSGSGPIALPPVPWNEKKNNWKFAVFRPTQESLLPQSPVWTDNFLLFLSSLQKLEQPAKKCIELRGQYVE